ncbi:MAG: hypothetical protein ABI778_04405 [Ignavibacteriota bacterium]
MMTRNKTRKKILDIIREHVFEHGYAPTADEIALTIGFSSHTTVRKHVHSLIEEKRLRFGLGGSWRTLRVVEKKKK